MIPRVAKMAAEVAAQFTTTQLEDYGNIILNGYATTGPNSTGKLAWQYKETTTAPVPLPSVTSYQPALKGWTTNYQEYYTQLQPNGYGVNPGDPTMFEYNVHSFTPQTGPIVALSWFSPGTGYTPGTYTAVPLTGGTGAGATANIVVVPDPDPLVVGTVQSVTLVNPGTGYTANQSLTASFGGGSGFYVLVPAILPSPGTGNQPRWAQAPRRFFQNQVSAVTPPQYVNNPQAIQYSFIYPVADNPVAPPIDGF
jgi:hypothetical protein